VPVALSAAFVLHYDFKGEGGNGAREGISSKRTRVGAQGITLDHRIRLIIDELAHNHSTKLRLPELAVRVNLSVRRVEQLFVEETGITYVAFRRRLRMRVAEGLLEHSTQEVKDVTEAIGYKAAAFFCREFKKNHGCTALTFRRNKS